MNNVKKISVVALFAALCFVATAFLAIPLPTGYANFGDCFAFTAGFVLGMPWGLAAAGIGSALADLFLGYAIYIPATAVLKMAIALFGALCARFLLGRKPMAFSKYVILFLSSLIGEIIMISGYFAYEYIVIGVKEAALVSIPANAGQGAVGIVSSLVIASVFLKVPALSRLMFTNQSKK